MGEQERLRKRIAEAVARFESEHMAVTAESVSVDLHPDFLIVTLRGSACPAEQRYAEGSPGRELLETLYDRAFDASRRHLEVVIEAILGREVQKSRLSVDTELGGCVILFTFASRGYDTDAACSRRAEPRAQDERPNEVEQI